MSMLAIIDCNSFYCSCERLFRPDLQQRPVVVLSNNDGCIIARTDEAKRLGIGMSGPYFQQKPLIEQHNVAVFSSNYGLYGDISRRVMDTLRTQIGSAQVEVYSVDEAFVDLHHIAPEELLSTGKMLKATVERWTGIAVSVGIAPSKVLSKVANRLCKKDKIGTQGVLVLDDIDRIREALQRTAVEDLWGIGRQYAIKLRNLGIETGWQLRNMPETWAHKHLGGVVGSRMIRELRGEACIPMKEPLEVKNMIATTRMFGVPATEKKTLQEAIATYACRAAEKLRRQYGATLQVDVFVITKQTDKQSDRYYTNQHACSTRLPFATSDSGVILQYALPLVDKLFEPGKQYLKAGVILSRIVPDAPLQGDLFTPEARPERRALMQAIDNINFSLRNDKVTYAASGTHRQWKMKQTMRSQCYTTRWDELYEIN